MSLFILSAVVYLHDLEVEFFVWLCVWRLTFKWVCAAKRGLQKGLHVPSSFLSSNLSPSVSLSVYLTLM